MKKRFLIATILSTTFLFVACGFNNDAKNEKTTGKVKVSFTKGGSGKSARTITSISSYDISTFDWTVEFVNQSTNESIEMSGGDVEIDLPPADYIAKASADYTDASSVVHHFYGETEFTVEVGEETDILIKVGLKKSATGKGTIGAITVDLTNVKNELDSQDGDLIATITPVYDGEMVTLDVEVSADGNTATLTTDAELAAGYYYLEVKYPDGTNLSISDFLVEISDDAETNGNLKAYATGLKRTYWAATDEGDDVPGEIGGGLSPSDKILLSEALDVLETGIEYWNEAEIYMTNDPEWDFSDYFISKPVTFVITKNGNVGKYSVYYNGADVIVTMEEGASELKVINGNPKISESGGTLSRITIKNGATFRIASSGDRTVELSFDETNTDIDYLYSEKAFAVVESGNVTFTLIKADQNSAYSIVVETSDLAKSYYVVKTGSANISLNSLPAFELDVEYRSDSGAVVVTDQLPYTNGTVTITATPKDGTESFAADTVFEWKINNSTISNANSGTLEFNPTQAPFFMNYGKNNVISCFASYEDKMQSAVFEFELISHFFADPGIMLWNSSNTESDVKKNNKEEKTNLTDLTLGIQSFSEITEITNVTSPFAGKTQDAIVKNFCFDAKNGNIFIWEGSRIKEYSSVDFTMCREVIPSGLNKPVSMAYFDNKLYILEEYSNNLSFIDMDNGGVVSDTGSFYPGSGSLLGGSSSPTALASDGKYLYVAYKISEYDEMNDVNNVSIKISQYNSSGTLLKSGKILDEDDLAGFGFNYEPFESSYEICDLQVIEDSIYCLLQCASGWTDMSGALIKAEIGASDINVVEMNGKKSLGWFEKMGTGVNNPLLDTDDLPENVFYGPRKFIAIKPDVLWIADEGAYCDGGSTKYNSNRIVKVDLGTMSMTSVSVEATLGGSNNSSSNYEQY